MIIKKIRLNNFRCFKDAVFDFNNRFVVIEGKNGSGKTSILEGIYYSCYLRSFRTRLQKELVHFEQNHFFLKTDFEQSDGATNQIQVGFSQDDGKLVKLNQKQVQSYKQVIDLYRIISIAEDDLLLISGPPEHRRAFLDQSLFLTNPDFVAQVRQYKKVLDQRKSFIFTYAKVPFTDALKQELHAWVKQHWQASIVLQKARVAILKELEKRVNVLLKEHFFPELSIKLEYVAKNVNLRQTFDQFWKSYQTDLLAKECKLMRCLFGFHIDDVSITFKKKKAKFYASRGQQKLILLLLKLAQLAHLQQDGVKGCLLLDDFLTDFDEGIVEKALMLLKRLDCQVFVTCPIQSFLVPKISDCSSFDVLHLD